jgi:hypothetical protein
MKLAFSNEMGIFCILKMNPRVSRQDAAPTLMKMWEWLPGTIFWGRF